MRDVIFSTIHGSHLYGLATEGSDLDEFIVENSPRKKATHTVVQTDEGQIDQVRVSLSRFLENVAKGSHQSVEAMFSPYKDWNPEYQYLEPMFETYRITGREVFARYERTVKSFCYGDFKKRRHAVRLNFNLYHLRFEGRFDPVLTEHEIDECNRLALEEGDDLRRQLLG